MAIRVIRNNIPEANARAGVEQAVLDAMGTRNGDWRVQIIEEAASPSWRITIWGPDAFKWTQEFWGPEEQNADDGYAFIKQKVSNAFLDRPKQARLLAYLSYALADNTDHFANRFGDYLANELHIQTGDAAEVWARDRPRPVGTQSRDIDIGNRIADSAFFIPILSPSYFKSEECLQELEFFISNSPDPSHPLIFPVYFVTAEEIERELSGAPNGSAQTLRRHVIFDLRQDRFDLRSEHALRTISRLAESIRHARAQLSTRRPAEVDANHNGPGRPVEPIYVETLSLQNFRCFEKLKLCFNRTSRLDGRWTCIAGVNGAGKSTVLQALGVALLGDPLVKELGGERLNRMRRLVDPLNRRTATVDVRLGAVESRESLQLNLAISDDRIVAQGGPASVTSPPTSWDRVRQLVVAGYGATRNLSSRADFGNEHLSADVRRQITLFDPLTQLAEAEVLLGRQSAGRAFQELFKEVVKQVFDKDLRIDFGFPPSGIRFTVSDQDIVEAIDLPDGFRSAAAWIADLCFIWCEKAPDLAASANPADLYAIVLIDEIDLHLHPSLQRALIPRLRSTFPKVQWIVTTHSPLVLANFDVNEIIALDRDQDGNVRELDRQILGFTTDEIYQWLMGTRPMGAAIEEEQRKSDAGVGEDRGEMARLMRISPGVSEEDAHKQIEEFKGILKTLHR